MDAGYFLIKALHVVSATLWLGGALFNVFLLQPVLGNATYATRREAMGRFGPALTRYFGIVGGLTFVTGLLVVAMHPHTRSLGWAGLTQDRWGKSVLFAIVGSFFALYLGVAALRPTYKAIGKIQAQMQPDQEPSAGLRFLMARVRFTNGLIAVLLVLVLGAMVYANASFFGP
jgi:uncharacterized membrane protein